MGESSGRESIGGGGADAQGAAVRRRRRTLARSAVETLARGVGVRERTLYGARKP